MVVVVTPTARTTPKHAQRLVVEDDVDAKLVRLLNLQGTIANSQSILGGIGPYDTLALKEYLLSLLWTSHARSQTLSDTILWNEIFNSICTILGSYVITQSQIKSLLNDLYLRNKSAITLSDASIQFILERSMRSADLKIMDSERILQLAQPYTRLAKVFELAYQCLYYILMILFYGLLIGRSVPRQPTYIIVNQKLLTKSLSTMMRNLKEKRRHGDLVVNQGYQLLSISSLMSLVLEPSFPGLAHLTPECQRLALDLAIRELKEVHKAAEVKQGFLLVPLTSSGEENLPYREESLSTPAVIATSALERGGSTVQKVNRQRNMSRKMR